MLKFILGFSLYTVVLSQSNYESGRGIWSLKDVAACEEELPTVHLALEISKNRMNRTHDGITAVIDAAADITDGYGVHIVACKYMDGGCKYFQNITSASFSNFVKSQFKDNVPRAFEAAKIDPPDFPIPTGHYEINNFIIDYCEVTNDAVYGTFEATVYILLGNEKVSCFTLAVEFDKLDDDNTCK